MAHLSSSPFNLSIKPRGDAPAFFHGFHLGTNELLARRLAEERFRGLLTQGKSTESVALIRDGKLVAAYDGEWSDGYVIPSGLPLAAFL